METKDRTVTVAVITGIVTLLLGCCLGALVGGAGGYAIGRRTAPQEIERMSPVIPETPGNPEQPALPERLAPGMGGVSGAVVREVISGSPAEKAGVKLGDVITAVDNTPIDANHRLVDVVSQYRPAAQVKLKVWRAGDTITLNVTLGENPDNKGQPYLGVYYVDFSILNSTPTPGE